jgi:hypothetical protein
MLRRPIKWGLRLLSVALLGDDYKLDFEWKPLRVLDAEKEEKIKSSEDARYAGWYDKGLIDAEKYEELAKRHKLAGADVDFERNPVSKQQVETQDLAEHAHSLTDKKEGGNPKEAGKRG